MSELHGVGKHLPGRQTCTLLARVDTSESRESSVKYGLVWFAISVAGWYDDTSLALQSSDSRVESCFQIRTRVPIRRQTLPCPSIRFHVSMFVLVTLAQPSPSPVSDSSPTRYPGPALMPVCTPPGFFVLRRRKVARHGGRLTGPVCTWSASKAREEGAVMQQDKSFRSITP